MITMNLFNDNKILTVSQLTSLVRGVLEENFEHVWVEGEVSNLAMPASGHVYFTLKDAGATLRCVMFRGSAKALRFRPVDGMKLIVRGRLTVYDQRGEYQMLAEYLEPQGYGALQLAFQQLKDRLAKEGLFAESRKKPLPLLPQRIGIVTSPTGAAIHDILNVIGRRFGDLNILIYPVRVQGEGAAGEIAAGVRELNRYREIDVIMVARGGGSLEDLWAFNEEVVARAIAASRIPVISAIGHEVDITIADLVADLRAPTPSAAAELVVSCKSQLTADCAALEKRLALAMRRRFAAAEAELFSLQRSLKGPEAVIGHLIQRIDDLQQRAEFAVTTSLARRVQRIDALGTELQLKSPLLRVERLRETFVRLCSRCDAAMLSRIHADNSTLARESGRLQALSPLAILGRGYAISHKLPERRLVRSVTQLQPGDRLNLEYVDGSCDCSVETISRKGPVELD